MLTRILAREQKSCARNFDSHSAARPALHSDAVPAGAGQQRIRGHLRDNLGSQHIVPGPVRGDAVLLLQRRSDLCDQKVAEAKLRAQKLTAALLVKLCLAD